MGEERSKVRRARAATGGLGCGGGQRQRPGQKNKIQDEKNKGRKRGPTKRQRPNENAIGQKQLPTYFSFLPTYLPTYLPIYLPTRKEKKRNCTRNGYNNRVRHFAFLSSFFFLSMLTRLVQSSFPYLPEKAPYPVGSG